MSRVGNTPITIPDGVEVQMDVSTLNVKGPKGGLSRVIPEGLTIRREEDKIYVERQSDSERHKSLHGLTRTLIANMMTGVSSGFEKSLEITGVGYRAVKKGENLELQVGHSHTVTIPKVEGVKIELPSPTKIVVKGADKQLVGDVAARIRSVRKPEPYKGKGIKYVGERIKRKVGKAVT